ncbi:MAG: hypothetical protein M1828_005333 [Chrysothrix sp. TS-e1954]|nr:MAG: hypothetical protein M1828_005333 [Chrysothrix sp. TS-e1954]
MGSSAATATDETFFHDAAVALQAEVSNSNKRKRKINTVENHDLRDYPEHGLFDRAINNTASDEHLQFVATQKAEALRELKARGGSKEDIDKLSQALSNFTGRGSCRSDRKGRWLVHGMSSSLEHYQVIGVSEMRQKESKTHSAPHGGILAYQMGLGKTPMTLACIVNGRSANQGPTLIVVDKSLISQWHGEIKKHVKSATDKNILTYYSGNKMKGDPEKLEISFRSFEFIITTYDEVSRSYPKSKSKEALEDTSTNEVGGILHLMKFNRIVLDEAQKIRNPKTQVSRACSALQGNYHWAVTGTPAYNRLEDFYAYFRFLRVPDTGSLSVFRHNFLNRGNREQGLERLRTVLRNHTLLKTHEDSFMGSKLLSLADPTFKTTIVKAGAFEKDLYQIVERRIRALLNCEKCPTALLLSLRLRQLTAHPLLLHDCLQDILESEDFQEIRDRLDRPDELDEQESLIRQNVRKMLDSGVPEAPLDSEDAPDPSEIEHQSAVDPTFGTAGMTKTESNTGGAYGSRNDFGRYFHTMEQDTALRQAEKTIKCPRCARKPRQPQKVSCGHTYCSECLMLMSHDAEDKDQGRNKCLACGDHYTGVPKSYGLFTASTDLFGVDGKPKRTNPRDIINKWVDGNGHILHSAKTLAVKEQILDWLKEDGQVKILVFTQFVSVIRILSRMCEIEKLGYCQFHGGIGLNLMMASHVIIMDPWWNNAITDKPLAFCRTFRRGQEKRTHLTRIIIEGTIDERIIRKQLEKKETIDTVMKTGQTPKISKEDLKALFSTEKTSIHTKGFLKKGNKRSKVAKAEPKSTANVVESDDDDDERDAALGATV